MAASSQRGFCSPDRKLNNSQRVSTPLSTESKRVAAETASQRLVTGNTRGAGWTAECRDKIAETMNTLASDVERLSAEVERIETENRKLLSQNDAYRQILNAIRQLILSAPSAESSVVDDLGWEASHTAARVLFGEANTSAASPPGTSAPSSASEPTDLHPVPPLHIAPPLPIKEGPVPSQAEGKQETLSMRIGFA